MTDTKTKTKTSDDDTKKSDGFLSTVDLRKTDKLLESVDTKWASLAGKDSIEKTVKALEAKTHKVTVVDDGAAALKIIQGLDGLKDSSLFAVGSTTLQEIGFTTWLKENESAVKRNIKAESVAAQAKGDWGQAISLLREGQSADYVFGSAPAIAETGEILVCCAGGARTGAYLFSAKKLILVVGANKIVSDYAAAKKRMEEYCLPFESARARIAYASMGIKGSAINFEATIHSGNAMLGVNRIHVIIVKQHLGY